MCVYYVILYCTSCYTFVLCMVLTHTKVVCFICWQYMHSCIVSHCVAVEFFVAPMMTYRNFEERQRGGGGEEGRREEEEDGACSHKNCRLRNTRCKWALRNAEKFEYPAPGVPPISLSLSLVLSDVSPLFLRAGKDVNKPKSLSRQIKCKWGEGFDVFE